MPLTLTFADQATGIVLDPEGGWELNGGREPSVAADLGTALESAAAYLRRHPGAEAWIGQGDLSFRVVLPPPPTFMRWLAAFKASGDLGGVDLGMHLGEVVSLLGLPRQTGCLSRRYPCSGVFRYDKALDFHFDRHGVLFLIHEDHVKVPRTVLV